MKILWLSHLLPFPPQGGGVLQRSANLLKVIADVHEVTLLAFNQKDVLRIHNKNLDVALPAALKALGNICRKVRVVNIDCDTKRAGKLRLALSSLFSKWPYSIRWLISNKYKKALDEILAETAYDAIWFDTISLSQYRFDTNMDHALTILNHHNIESDMMLRRARIECNIFKKAYFYLESYKLGVYEKKEGCRFNLNITCSEIDARRIEIISPGSTTYVVPNGVDTGFFLPDSKIKPDPFCLIFIGGMSWYPNREAMLFFAQQVWPLLKKKIPDIHMHVVGETPPEEIIKLSKVDANYHVHGFVNDIKEIFCNAGIYVCPIYNGGGTKLKILDALAMGKPIVANRIACEGIDVIEGKNVLYAERPEEYVNKISELIETPSLREKLSKANSKLIVTKYSYDVIGQELLSLLESKM